MSLWDYLCLLKLNMYIHVRAKLNIFTNVKLHSCWALHIIDNRRSVGLLAVTCRHVVIS